jgi:hypothetical protein
VCVLVLSCLVSAGVTAASEPDGDFRLRLERLPTSDGSIVVRLKVHPFVAVDNATLTVSAPLDFDLRPQTPSRHDRLEVLDDSYGATKLRAVLRDLGTSATAVDLELVLAPQIFGTLDFVVEGVDGQGRTLRDAVGLLLPDPTERAVRRLGAIEYPAIVFPNEGAR